MSKILIPANSADDWKQFLAEPNKQWKSGYSARSLAHCWQDADGMPADVRRVLEQEPIFNGLATLFAIPEHKVDLPGGRRPSQNDIWVLARSRSGLVSIAVEGKVSEAFGPTVGQWLRDASPGKRERLEFLRAELGIADAVPEDVRYQLLHRAASAVIEAKRFCARQAVLLVHSFSKDDEWLDDYRRFASLFGVDAAPNRVTPFG